MAGESTHVIAIAITVTYNCSLTNAFHNADDEYRTVFERATISIRMHDEHEPMLTL
jgi:hypothetical protein